MNVTASKSRVFAVLPREATETRRSCTAAVLLSDLLSGSLLLYFVSAWSLKQQTDTGQNQYLLVVAKKLEKKGSCILFY